MLSFYWTSYVVGIRLDKFSNARRELRYGLAVTSQGRWDSEFFALSTRSWMRSLNFQRNLGISGFLDFLVVYLHACIYLKEQESCKVQL